MALVHSLLFPAPAPVWVTVMAMAIFLAFVNGGVNEMRGKNAQYSKLMGPTSAAKIPTKTGMTVLYSPAFLFCAASFFIFSGEDSRFFLIRCALTFHFLKRLLETWFVHKFSGEMTVEFMAIGAVTYLMLSFVTIYAQYVSSDLPQPPMDLRYGGLVLFFIGIWGNYYHHYLLSTLRRKDDDKAYNIPEGGLFGVVICPHYMFEVVEFWGLVLVAQTSGAILIAAGVTVNLVGRSRATRKWYVSKFEDFPAHVKAVIPFIL